MNNQLPAAHQDRSTSPASIKTTLNLSSSNLKVISGIGGTKLHAAQIIHLDLSRNQLLRIQNLDRFTCLQRLNLSYNRIEWIENIDTLSQLVHFDLSHNHIHILPKSLSILSKLTFIDVSYNRIQTVDALAILERIPSLCAFDVSNNPLDNITFAQQQQQQYESKENINIINNSYSQTNKQMNNIIKTINAPIYFPTNSSKQKPLHTYHLSDHMHHFTNSKSPKNSSQLTSRTTTPTNTQFNNTRMIFPAVRHPSHNNLFRTMSHQPNSPNDCSNTQQQQQQQKQVIDEQCSPSYPKSTEELQENINSIESSMQKFSELVDLIQSSFQESQMQIKNPNSENNQQFKINNLLNKLRKCTTFSVRTNSREPSGTTIIEKVEQLLKTNSENSVPINILEKAISLIETTIETFPEFPYNLADLLQRLSVLEEESTRWKQIELLAIPTNPARQLLSSHLVSHILTLIELLNSTSTSFIQSNTAQVNTLNSFLEQLTELLNSNQNHNAIHDLLFSDLINNKHQEDNQSLIPSPQPTQDYTNTLKANCVNCQTKDEQILQLQKYIQESILTKKLIQQQIKQESEISMMIRGFITEFQEKLSAIFEKTVEIRDYLQSTNKKLTEISLSPNETTASMWGILMKSQAKSIESLISTSDQKDQLITQLSSTLSEKLLQFPVSAPAKSSTPEIGIKDQQNPIPNKKSATAFASPPPSSAASSASQNSNLKRIEDVSGWLTSPAKSLHSSGSQASLSISSKPIVNFFNMKQFHSKLGAATTVADQPTTTLSNPQAQPYLQITEIIDDDSEESPMFNQTESKEYHPTTEKSNKNLAWSSTAANVLKSIEVQEYQIHDYNLRKQQLLSERSDRNSARNTQSASNPNINCCKTSKGAIYPNHEKTISLSGCVDKSQNSSSICNRSSNSSSVLSKNAYYQQIIEKGQKKRENKDKQVALKSMRQSMNNINVSNSMNSSSVGVVGHPSAVATPDSSREFVQKSPFRAGLIRNNSTNNISVPSHHQHSERVTSPLLVTKKSMQRADTTIQSDIVSSYQLSQFLINNTDMNSERQSRQSKKKRFF